MTMNDSCRALLIDLDGTMVDTAPDIVAAVGCMLADFGAAPLPFDTVTGFIGRGVRNLVRRSLATARIDPRIDIERAQRAFEHHYAVTNGQLGGVFPGVVAGLREVRRHGYRTACVTNKPHALADALLSRTGLAHYLDVLVAGDTLASMKPSAEPLWHACGLLGAKREACALVGDSAIDVAAARAAGMPVFIVSYGYGGRDGNLEALNCDALIDSFEALAPMLAQPLPIAKAN